MTSSPPTLSPLQVGEAPGPTSLLQDAIRKPNSAPISEEPSSAEVEEHKEEEFEQDTGGSATPTSDEEGLRPRAKATTTITTISSEPHSQSNETTTETITHFGASSITTSLASDGSFSLTPIPAKTNPSKKIKTKRVHTFEPRISRFDRDNPDSQLDPFRGFYTLFWIIIAVGAVRTLVTHYYTLKAPLQLQFATLISRDMFVLGLSDAVMVGTTFLCVPFMKLIHKGYFRYYGPGIVLQHVFQTLFLLTVVRWVFFRNWYWVQAGFLTLHTLSTLMKVHSYISTNGELSEKLREVREGEKKLKVLVEENGGKKVCESTAMKVWEEEQRRENGKRGEEVKMKDFEAPPNVGLTRRRSGSGSTASTNSPTTTTTTTTSSRRRSSSSSSYSATHLEVLTWHPSSQLSSLASSILELKDSLISPGIKKVPYPQNVTYLNFVDFLFLPTLVYQLEYPRTTKIRPMYVIEKTLATFGTFTLLVLIVEHYILPFSPDVHQNSFFVATLDLAMPFMINYLLIFYIIFECICNVFAELTMFADREFYGDWWNSTSFDEFSRKWNKPVHQHLLRHVYTSTIDTYNFSKFQAAFVTFLLSALVHELVMAVVTKKIRLYLFVLQMAQLPLIMLGRLPILKKYPALGNLFFWVGLLSGFPLLAVAYIRF